MQKQGLLVGLFVGLLAAVCLGMPGQSWAAPGDLDTTFDGDGIVRTEIGASSSQGRDVAQQADGKLVVTGWILRTGTQQDFGTARYNTDGSLDTSFGSGGVAATALGSNLVARGEALALQSDGKIVVVGFNQVYNNQNTAKFTVVRYNTTGSLDTSFGSGGIVQTDVVANGREGPGEIAIQPDGKIVVVGYAQVGGGRDTVVLRYNTNGTLDSSFGSGGIVHISHSSSYDDFWAVALQPDGKIVCAGDYLIGGTWWATDTNTLVARYNANGTLDTSFGTGGIVVHDVLPNQLDRFFGVAVRPDGKLVMGGTAAVPGRADGDLLLARYNTDGTPDTGFGSGGFVITGTPPGQWADSRDMVLQPDGKILQVARAYAMLPGSTKRDWVLARYNTDGTLDSSFATGGLSVHDVGPGADADDTPVSVILQSDGKIVAAGTATDAAGRWAFTLTRHEGDPTAVCGNSVVEPGEQCDDGNTNDGDCCSSSCELESAATVCRASAGVCDVAENCTGSDPNCPADGYESATTECRASAGICDVAESCTGSAADCPVDGYESATTECRASAGICDVAESCTGSGADCPVDGYAAPTECRASAGVCDVAESCTGIGPDCPADGYESATTECRASAGVCDIAESCTGSGVDCPADGYVSATTECRASAGVCDVAESCTGSGPDCPADGFESATTECRASAGICDVAESCTGSGADCPADGYDTGTECRADSGECDVAEQCSGTGPDCPPDGFEPNGLSCDDADVCTVNDWCEDGVCGGNPDICGDGTTQAGCGEECDDGNNFDGDGCSAICLFESQDKDQQKCITQLNKSFAKVAVAEAKHLSGCIDDGSRGSLSGGAPVETCIAAPGTKVTQAQQKLAAKVAQRCAAKLPDFGVVLTTDPNFPAEVDTGRANAVAVEKELALIRAIFGTDLDAVVDPSNGRAEGKCQVEVTKQARKCQDVKLDEFIKCKKKGLRGASSPLQVPDPGVTPFTGPGDMETCMGFDPRSQIEAACVTKLSRKIDQRCANLSYATLFGGECSGEATLADFEVCIDRLIECQVCSALNDVDALDRDCDEFDDGVVNGSCVAAPSKVVFVTSTTHAADLGSLAAADAICAARAAAGGLTGTFMAWLADDVEAPATRFTQSAVPYLRMDGAVVADDWADLTDGSIQNPINVDEFGDTIPALSPTSTHVDTDGTVDTDSSGGNCLNWTTTSSSEYGDFGRAENVDATWTTGWYMNCGASRHLYCFEQ